jgi:F0F1-type ATP synthase assembly protein I
LWRFFKIKNKNEDDKEKSLTIADVVCTWYWGAAVGAGVGYLGGNAVAGIIIGAIVGLLLQRIFKSKKK